MALTFSVVDSMVEGNKRVVTADVTFDNSYLTGGEPVTPAALGLSSILFVHAGTKTNYMIQFDAAAVKLLAFISSTGLQVANAVDLSALSIRVRFVGN